MQIKKKKLWKKLIVEYFCINGLYHDTDLFNLHDFLFKSYIGQDIIKNYEKNSLLSKKMQK